MLQFCAIEALSLLFDCLSRKALPRNSLQDYLDLLPIDIIGATKVVTYVDIFEIKVVILPLLNKYETLSDDEKTNMDCSVNGLFGSCFLYQREQSRNMLVINSLVVADTSVIRAKVSHSVFFLNGHSSLKIINNAHIEVSVNGEKIGTMTFKGSVNEEAVYEIPHTVRSGDRVRISATCSGYEAASAETQVPRGTPIVAVDTVTKKGNYNINKCLCVNIGFSDNAAEDNYYQVRVKKILWVRSQEDTTKIMRQVYNVRLQSEDVVFGSSANKDNPIFGYNNKIVGVFDDHLINGKDYTVKVFSSEIFSGSSVAGRNDTLEVYLNTVSRDYYLFQKTYLAYINNNDFSDIFGEPVQIYSNVVGGIGLVGGVAESKETIVLKKR